jgi:hypothetical protein
MAQLKANQHYLRTALALAYGARAAYRDKPGSDAKFAAMSWDTVKTFSSASTHTQGFVAANADHVVVSFRGTEPKEIEDWLTDLRYNYYPRRMGGGNVHNGFWTAWRSVKSKVVDQLQTAVTNKQTIWFTGHSLGAALATLAARDMPKNFKPTAVHTFGSPRCGSPQYAKAYNVHAKRFVNENDIVAHVPLQGIFQKYKYCHVGQRQIMQPDGKITSSSAAWTRLLKNLAKVSVLGIGSTAASSIKNHSMNRYIGKLAKHGANRGRA